MERLKRRNLFFYRVIMLSLVFMLSFTLMFVQPRAKAFVFALPAGYTIGSGAVVAGALATATVAGALGYTEYEEEINDFAQRTWSSTSDVLKNSWEATTDTVNWAFGQSTYEVDNSQYLADMSMVTQNVVKNALPTIATGTAMAERDLSTINADRWSNTKNAIVSTEVSTNFPEVIRNVEYNAYRGIYDRISLTVPESSDLVFSYRDPTGQLILAKEFLLYGSNGNANFYVKLAEIVHGPTTASAVTLASSSSTAIDELLSGTSLADLSALIGNLMNVEDVIDWSKLNGAILEINMHTDALLNDLVQAENFINDQAFGQNIGLNDKVHLPLPRAYTNQRVNGLSAGADLVWNPADSLWATPDGSVTVNEGNPAVTKNPAIGRAVLKNGVYVPAFAIPNVGITDLTTGLTADPPAEGGSGTGTKDPRTSSQKFGTLVTTKFPFSLPWDIKLMIDLLTAEPEAPRIVFDHQFRDIPIHFDITLDRLDPYLPFFRGFLIVSFSMFLILNTRKILGGGV